METEKEELYAKIDGMDLHIVTEYIDGKTICEMVSGNVLLLHKICADYQNNNPDFQYTITNIF